nr:GNAT family N-acetyltransferase [Candidatus Njordarchaeum guaymaensis]
MVTIATERLKLREFDQDDWVSVHKYASDPEVVRYLTWGPNSREDTKNFITKALTYQREQPRRNFDLAVILKEEDTLIGGCSIRVSDPDNREGWIGYLIRRQFWRRGYATEATRALLAYGFNQLGLHRIYATCDTENVPSTRVLQKIGMRREGLLREHKLQKDKWRNSYLYAILAHEWKSRDLIEV